MTGQCVDLLLVFTVGLQYGHCSETTFVTLFESLEYAVDSFVLVTFVLRSV